MATMNESEIRAFLTEGSPTAQIATVRQDGRPHVVTIWFLMDGDDVMFTTAENSVKGRILRRTGYAALCIDDPNPPYSYVKLEGPVEVIDDLDQLRAWATKLGGRYMGEDRAEEFGRRNGVPPEVLMRLRPVKRSGVARITDE